MVLGWQVCLSGSWTRERPDDPRFLGLMVLLSGGLCNSQEVRLAGRIHELPHGNTWARTKQKRQYASVGMDKRNSRVIYLEGLRTSLISNGYPDMESERFDVTTVVILSKSGIAQNPVGLKVSTRDKLVRGV